MSIGNYTHITRADGTVLTAAIYNTDHTNHILNQNPTSTGAYQDTVPQKQLMSTPGTVGSEILADSLASEIEQIRFQLKSIIGGPQWYSPPTASLSNVASSISLGLLPGGRLSLATNQPVFIGSGNTLYYTPYLHSFIPLFDGVSFTATDFGEVSQTTTDATKSPAATIANAIYDVFAWKDPSGNVNRISRGVPWLSDGARAIGADLVRQNGVWLNNGDITNGPAAKRGTYLGTVKTNAANNFESSAGGTGPGGIPAFMYLWNAYNRVNSSCRVTNTNTWGAGGSDVWVPSNGSLNFRISLVRGLPVGGLSNSIISVYVAGVGGSIAMGLSLDTLAGPSLIATYNNLNAGITTVSVNGAVPSMPAGAHFLQALESFSVVPGNFFGGTSILADIEW